MSMGHAPTYLPTHSPTHLSTMSAQAIILVRGAAGGNKWAELQRFYKHTRRNIDQGISVIEMPVRLTLGIIPFGHNNSGAGL